eukprot:229507-Chlamydomonas_euryale.AAC.3
MIAGSLCCVYLPAPLHAPSLHPPLACAGRRTTPRRTHRGACGCEENTGDGAGILVAIPDSFLQSRVQAEEGVTLPPLGDYAVGQIFLPRDEGLRRKARTIIEKAVQKLGHDILTWRKVPTDNRRLGASAVRTEPVVEQLFISAHGSLKHLKPETQSQWPPPPPAPVATRHAGRIAGGAPACTHTGGRGSPLSG